MGDPGGGLGVVLVERSAHFRNEQGSAGGRDDRTVRAAERESDGKDVYFWTSDGVWRLSPK